MADAATAETFDAVLEQIRTHRFLTRGAKVAVTFHLSNETGLELLRSVAAEFFLTVHKLQDDPGRVVVKKQVTGKTPLEAAIALRALLDQELADQVKLHRESLASYVADTRAKIEALTGTPEAP